MLIRRLRRYISADMASRLLSDFSVATTRQCSRKFATVSNTSREEINGKKKYIAMLEATDIEASHCCEALQSSHVLLIMR
jgi:hypothetical protein